jgi:hypothetical protein
MKVSMHLIFKHLIECFPILLKKIDHTMAYFLSPHVNFLIL